MELNSLLILLEAAEYLERRDRGTERREPLSLCCEAIAAGPGPAHHLPTAGHGARLSALFLFFYFIFHIYTIFIFSGFHPRGWGGSSGGGTWGVVALLCVVCVCVIGVCVSVCLSVCVIGVSVLCVAALRDAGMKSQQINRKQILFFTPSVPAKEEKNAWKKYIATNADFVPRSRTWLCISVTLR